MRCSASSGNVTGASNKTLIAVMGVSGRAPELLQVIIGCPDTPADNAARFAIRYMTADGTGTGGTPLATRRYLGAPNCTVKVNYTAEPTYATGNLIEIPLNQRGTLIWNVPPGGGWESEAGTGKGWGIQMIAGPAVNYNVSLVWDE